MKKRILITVGGTGGHIYPAVALAHDLPDCELLFVGGGLKNNRYFSQNSFPFEEVSCGTFSLKRPFRAISGVFKIGRGIRQSSKIIKKFRPDLVVGFGSYYTLPMLIAAKMKGIPILLHEANRIPGRVNKLFAPYVSLTGVHFPDTKLSGKKEHIAMPLRKGYQFGQVKQSEALQYFQLDPNKKTLLVFGGSQGAHAINRAVLQALPSVAGRLQILHVAGDKANADFLEQEYSKLPLKYCVKPFENRMDLAWQAADLAICRSGAGTIAEAIEFQVPALYIPFPQAIDNHQEFNADFVVDHIGGGMRARERDLTPHSLAEILSDWLNEDGKVLSEMKQALQNYKCSCKTPQLADVICRMIRISI